MNKLYLIAGAALLIILLLGGEYKFAYNQGWYAHSKKVNDEYLAKQVKIDAAVKPVMVEAADEKEKTEVQTQYITKQVTVYVKDPKHIRCDFDDERVRIKSDAVKLANGGTVDDGKTLPNTTTK